MKIKLNEDFGLNSFFLFTLEPENTLEAAQLLRLANEGKRKAIEIETSFNAEIYCEFKVDKRDHYHHKNIISNENRSL